ncbi:MAG TPA: TonB-dependent receptor [Gemmatimonadaceae bacterium]|nr:TonB-dependent receptor [Gemmatimonadaceae bacterium]
MVRSVQRWLARALVALAAFASVAAAQSGQITGRVTDAETGSPVSDVRVEARSGGVVRTALSTTSGSYRLGGLPAGEFTVRFARVGYAVSTRTATVGEGATVTLDATLTAVAVELNPTIISAGRVEEKALEAPASVAVVPERDIQESPTLTLNDQIKSQPGVDMAQTGLVTNNTVTRGFNNVFSGSMLTLTDNRYAFVPSLRVNTSFLVPTANEDIGRIEVLLGPASALYGPNSANGVMHVITKTPFESQGTTLSLGGGTRGQSDALPAGVDEDLGDRTFTRAALRHAGVVGERFGYKLSGQYMQGTDWRFDDPGEPDSIRAYPGAPPSRCSSESGLCLNVRDFDVERWALEGRTDFRPTEQTDFILGAGASHAGSAIEMTGLGAAQVKDWRYTYVQGRARWNRLFVQGFVNMSDAGDTYLLRTGQRIIDESRMYVGQVQHGMFVGERFDFIYGVDAQKTDPSTGGTINGRNEDIDEITEVGAYLHSKTALTDRLDLFAAIRVDDHSELEDPVWSPRGALVFKATDNHSLRFSYNRAFSTPSTNNLFLDIVAAQIPVLTATYNVRTLGVPKEGFTFSRECPSGVGGLCMRSPFAPNPDAFIPADATLMWQLAAQVIYAQSNQQIDLRAAPAPTAQQVGTVLRALNPTTGLFSTVEPGDVTNISRLEPTTNEVLEGGYRGILGERLLLAANVFYEKRTNFIGPLIVETPNVFFEAQGLAAYIAALLEQGGMPAAQAAQLGQQFGFGIGGISDNATRGLPLGTVSPVGGLASGHDLILTYRNFGELDLYGADFGVDVLLTDRWTASGTFSWASDDFFPQSEVGGLTDIALNAPKTRGTAGLRYRTDMVTVQGRGRFAAAFPMNSGVYIGDVESHTLIDFNVSYRPNFAPNTLFSLDVQNAFNDQKQQFVGAPAIGRLVFLQAQYTFGAR